MDMKYYVLLANGNYKNQASKRQYCIKQVEIVRATTRDEAVLPRELAQPNPARVRGSQFVNIIFVLEG